MLSVLMLVLLGMIGEPRFKLLERNVSANGGTWNIRYRVQYTGPARAIEVKRIEYSGDLSNSSVPGHQCPRAVSYSGIVPGSVELIAGSGGRQGCRERFAVALPVVTVKDGQVLNLFVMLKHEHAPYGPWFQLLGTRHLVIEFGEGLKLIDDLDLLEPAKGLPALMLGSVSAQSRMTNEYYHSPPTSLLLFCDGEEAPGMQFFRFDDVAVQPGSRLRLEFWYLLAFGSRAAARVRVTEYLDLDSNWVRGKEPVEEELTEYGFPWRKFSREFTVGEANSLAVDFRFIDGDLGKLWFDDVKLQYVQE